MKSAFGGSVTCTDFQTEDSRTINLYFTAFIIMYSAHDTIIHYAEVIALLFRDAILGDPRFCADSLVFIEYEYK